MIAYRILAAAAYLVLTLGSAAASPPPLRVYAAGSLGGALSEIDQRYTAQTGQKIDLVLGPAGLLLARIERDPDADLFISANMAHPLRLAAEGRGTPPIIFTRNRLCLLARPDLGLTRANMLSRMLDPAVRIGTSTPGDDPGGDYAWLLFEKADALHPGAGMVLKDKAQKLVGGPVAPKVPGGRDAVKYFLRSGTVSAFVGYCSGHEKTPDPRFVQVEVPAPLSVPVEYGLTVLAGSKPSATQQAAYRFALYLMSPPAQALLGPYGFIPVTADLR